VTGAQKLAEWLSGTKGPWRADLFTAPEDRGLDPLDATAGRLALAADRWAFDPQAGGLAFYVHGPGGECLAELVLAAGSLSEPWEFAGGRGRACRCANLETPAPGFSRQLVLAVRDLGPDEEEL
jgi:hypothetical protein